MKTKIKSVIVVLSLLFSCSGLLNAQGLYNNPSTSKEEVNTEGMEINSQGLYGESPMLKAKPGGGTAEPGTSPVSDGVWVVLFVAGCYGIKLYANSRKRAKG